MPPLTNSQAIEILQKEARAGRVIAMEALGYAYFGGEGVKQNYNRALYGEKGLAVLLGIAALIQSANEAVPAEGMRWKCVGGVGTVQRCGWSY